jgi:hypothetical protein
LVRVATVILGFLKIFELKTHNVSRALFASVFRWKGEKGLMFWAGPVEETGLTRIMAVRCKTHTKPLVGKMRRVVGLNIYRVFIQGVFGGICRTS